MDRFISFEIEKRHLFHEKDAQKCGQCDCELAEACGCQGRKRLDHQARRQPCTQGQAEQKRRQHDCVGVGRRAECHHQSPAPGNFVKHSHESRKRVHPDEKSRGSFR